MNDKHKWMGFFGALTGFLLAGTLGFAQQTPTLSLSGSDSGSGGAPADGLKSPPVHPTIDCSTILENLASSAGTALSSLSGLQQDQASYKQAKARVSQARAAYGAAYAQCLQEGPGGKDCAVANADEKKVHQAESEEVAAKARLKSDGNLANNKTGRLNQSAAVYNYCLNHGGLFGGGGGQEGNAMSQGNAPLQPSVEGIASKMGATSHGSPPLGGSHVPVDIPPPPPPGFKASGPGAGGTGVPDSGASGGKVSPSAYGASGGSAQFQPFTADGYPVFSDAQIASIDAQYAQMNKEIATYGMTPSFTDAEDRQILINYDHVQQLREAEKSVYPPGGAGGSPACMGASDGAYGFSDSAWAALSSAPWGMDPANGDVQLGRWSATAAQKAKFDPGTWVMETNESAYRNWAKEMGVTLDRFVARSPDSNVGENGITDEASQKAYWAAHGIVDKHLFDSSGDWLGSSNGRCPSGPLGSGSAASAASAGALPSAHSVNLASGSGLPDRGVPLGQTSQRAAGAHFLGATLPGRGSVPWATRANGAGELNQRADLRRN